MADLTVGEVFKGPGVNNFTLSAKSDQRISDEFGIIAEFPDITASNVSGIKHALCIITTSCYSCI